jgi:hypothetical protein
MPGAGPDEQAKRLRLRRLQAQMQQIECMLEEEDAADLEEAREKAAKTAPRSRVRQPPRRPTLKPRLDEKARFCKEQQTVGLSSSLAAQMQQLNTGQQTATTGNEVEAVAAALAAELPDPLASPARFNKYQAGGDEDHDFVASLLPVPTESFLRLTGGAPLAPGGAPSWASAGLRARAPEPEPEPLPLGADGALSLTGVLATGEPGFMHSLLPTADEEGRTQGLRRRWRAFWKPFDQQLEKPGLRVPPRLRLPPVGWSLANVLELEQEILEAGGVPPRQLGALPLRHTGSVAESEQCPICLDGFTGSPRGFGAPDSGAGTRRGPTSAARPTGLRKDGRRRAGPVAHSRWLRSLPCGHLFHHRCICGWLMSHDLCPLCRSPASFGVDEDGGQRRMVA